MLYKDEISTDHRYDLTENLKPTNYINSNVELVFSQSNNNKEWMNVYTSIWVCGHLSLRWLNEDIIIIKDRYNIYISWLVVVVVYFISICILCFVVSAWRAVCHHKQCQTFSFSIYICLNMVILWLPSFRVVCVCVCACVNWLDRLRKKCNNTYISVSDSSRPKLL